MARRDRFPERTSDPLYRVQTYLARRQGASDPARERRLRRARDRVPEVDPGAAVQTIASADPDPSLLEDGRLYRTNAGSFGRHVFVVRSRDAAGVPRRETVVTGSDIAPGATVGTGFTVGEVVTLGDNITIGDDVIVGAGVSIPAAVAVRTGSGAWNPGNLASMASESKQFTVAGVSPVNTACMAFLTSLPADQSQLSAKPVSGNTVQVSLLNANTTDKDYGLGDVFIICISQN